MAGMRSLLPFLSVILALIAAGSIAYIAWELTSGKLDSGTPNRTEPPENDESETPP
jgi:hypothetical protein